ncbi:MAG TPA: hypothetical protein VJ963_06265 [Bacteroidales bacterium]|nr:hypothetical protein [Bacteroidales bacterium]
MKVKTLGLIIMLSGIFVTGISQNISTESKYHDPLLGENIFVFDPAMDMNEIQVVLDTLFNRQKSARSEFNKNRYALLFKPGIYKLDIQVGYYMQVAGLGTSPDDVVIMGAVRSNTTHHNSVLTNFWRSVENLTVIPQNDSANVWGVSQAAPMRRVHIKGDLNLFDKGYASGGFLADSKIDGIVSSGPQQQWFSRNTEWGKWVGGNWNMMFMGVENAPPGDWPEKPYTRIETTPLVREKPYLTWENGEFCVRIPALKKDSKGPGWTTGQLNDRVIPLRDFYIANAETDNSSTINSALLRGRNIIITPGIYKLDKCLLVTHPEALVLGLGFPSLTPLTGHSVMRLFDGDGITVADLIMDAGADKSENLLQVGEKGAFHSHADNPVFLFDIFCRVGGPFKGSTVSCVEINSNDVYIDHTWLWRADHGHGVGWDLNRCANGLVVNGNNVTVYGLFNEHFQEYQTLWNGENGHVYFYQSEMPYDPPSVEAWKHDGIYGYASYKVSDAVKTHEAWGIGIYNVFYDAPVIVDNAIEVPAALVKDFHHMIIFWLNGNKESVVKSIINGEGGPVNFNHRKAVMN